MKRKTAKPKKSKRQTLKELPQFAGRFSEGWQARLKGAKKTDNPYPVQPRQALEAETPWESWLRGWEGADSRQRRLKNYMLGEWERGLLVQRLSMN